MQDVIPPRSRGATPRLRPVGRSQAPALNSRRVAHDVFVARRQSIAVSRQARLARVQSPEPQSPAKIPAPQEPVNEAVEFVAEAPQVAPQAPKRFGLWSVLLGSAAVITLALTGYVSFDTWRTNTKVTAEYKHGDSNGSAKGTPSDTDKTSEGKDETQIPHSSLASYTVAAGMPRALYVDKLKVAARILPMSVNLDNSIQTPKNIYDSGWYDASARPGSVGAVFIDGHASGPTRQGLFAYLDTLKAGDTMRVEMGDKSSYTYRVVRVATVPLEGFDMNTMLRPQDGTLKGLNLMTCTGKWLADKHTYDHRVTVYTEQVSYAKSTN